MEATLNPLLPCSKGTLMSIGALMKILFKSQDLWDLVESGTWDGDRKKKKKKKEAKALFLIQQAVHDTLFSRIAKATSSKEAWKMLNKEFQCLAKVSTVK